MIYAKNKSLRLLLTSIIIWGASFPVIKYALAYIGPIEFLLYRVAIASCILVPLALYGWKINGEYLSFRRATLLTLLGMFGSGLSLALLYLGMNLTLSSRAVIIMATGPVFTMYLLRALKKANPHVALGAIVVLVGLAVLITGESQHLAGNLLVVAAALVWAAYTALKKVFFEKQTEKNSPITASALGFLGTTAALIPVVALNKMSVLLNPISSLDARVTPSLLYLAIISSVLGFITYDAGSKIVGPKKASRFLYLQPLVALPLAFLWLREPISFPFLLAAGIICFGVYLTEHETESSSSLLS